MRSAPRWKGWLPKLKPALTARLNGLLRPGSLVEGDDSIAMLARGALEDVLQSRATAFHLEPFMPPHSLQIRSRILFGLRWLRYFDSLHADL